MGREKGKRVVGSRIGTTYCSNCLARIPVPLVTTCKIALWYCWPPCWFGMHAKKTSLSLSLVSRPFWVEPKPSSFPIPFSPFRWWMILHAQRGGGREEGGGRSTRPYITHPTRSLVSFVFTLYKSSKKRDLESCQARASIQTRGVLFPCTYVLRK